MAKSNSYISPEEFVKIWQKAKNIKEITDKTGLKVSTVASRAVHYRNIGISLKKFKERSLLDIPSLVALAKKYAPKD